VSFLWFRIYTRRIGYKRFKIMGFERIPMSAINAFGEVKFRTKRKMVFCTKCKRVYRDELLDPIPPDLDIIGNALISEDGIELL